MSLKIAGIQTAFLLLLGCKSEPEWVTSNLVAEVHIVYDSPKVQYLVSSQEEHDAAELRWLRGLEPRGQPEPIPENQMSSRSTASLMKWRPRRDSLFEEIPRVG